MALTEFPRGTLMWFGQFEMGLIGGNTIFFEKGSSIIMFPDGSIVVCRGLQKQLWRREEVREVKMLGIPEGENDVFWQHPDFRDFKQGVYHDDERTRP